MVVSQSEEAHARCVLERFVRRFIVTYLTRHAHRNLTLLETAFRNARDHRRYHPEEITSPQVILSLDPEYVMEKRHHFARKYNASCVRPPSPQALDEMISKSIYKITKSDQLDIASESSRDSHEDENAERNHRHQHATFEVVVQRLYTQLQQSRDEIARKDMRIQELEALLAESRCLAEKLHESRQASIKVESAVHIADSNQITS